ncbi:hypothetical protein BX666DRAFT_1881795 [Dichotomocladium elegans]|nr:hypothetical protein BX666DRAFT_1881795 [Dichotomocladium elegans]
MKKNWSASTTTAFSDNIDDDDNDDDDDDDEEDEEDDETLPILDLQEPQPPLSGDDDHHPTPGSLVNGRCQHPRTGVKTQYQQDSSQDDYSVSWTDELTGDDLLTPMRTIQYIFAEQPEDNPNGLSDLIEKRAKQIREFMIEMANRPDSEEEDYENGENDDDDEDNEENVSADDDEKEGGRERQEKSLEDQERDAKNMNGHDAADRNGSSSSSNNNNNSLRQYAQRYPGECYTLHYRKGPPHQALTLYHTMKMDRPGDRAEAYDYTPRQCYYNKKPGRKFALRISSNKQFHGTEVMAAKINSKSTLTAARPYWTASAPTLDQQHLYRDKGTPTDLLSAAFALVPSPAALHESWKASSMAKPRIPFHYIDTPAKPIPLLPQQQPSSSLEKNRESLRQRSGTFTSIQSESSNTVKI